MKIKDKYDVIIIGSGISGLCCGALLSMEGKKVLILEKHFKLDNEECGPDSSFSVTPNELKSLVEECNLSFHASKLNYLKRSPSEKNNKKFRRSIYFVKNLPQGHILKKDDIRRIRPGYGLNPKYFTQIIGKKLSQSVEAADPVKWHCFE